MAIQTVLKKYFGYDTFRPGQEDIINQMIYGKDVLAILPTGGGKSLCYQIPALVNSGLTLVISPLISLMKDQTDTLNQLGIPAAYLNSTLSSVEFKQVMRQVYNSELKLLYVAPERLQNQSFIQMMNRIQLDMVAVDEAHCVSQWGHAFRPDYRLIVGFINQLEKRPVIGAFTATATGVVQKDIINHLELEQPQVFVNSFDRPNIRFSIKEPKNKINALKTLVNDQESIIIYGQTRKTVDKIYEKLLDAGFKAQKYHAGLSTEQRQVAQDDFIFDRVNIVVATNAFGMGIDKTDVRKVIHYNMPTDLESYYQEAGRAGRDGLEAEAILLFSAQDIITAKQLIARNSDPSAESRLSAIIQYCNQTNCLRQFVLRYFGETDTVPCQNCSSCLQEFDTRDVTVESQKILSCIIRMDQSFGMTMVTDVLRGKASEKLRKWRFNELSTYGIMSSNPEQEVKDIMSQLLASDMLNVNEHGGLFVTELARDVLTGKENIVIKQKDYKRKSPRSVAKPHDLPTKRIAKHADNTNDLFEQLREVRYELASDQNVPAYVVFNNNTLIDMVEKLPTSLDEFLEVDGVGEVKAQQYYEVFIAVIMEYVENK